MDGNSAKRLSIASLLAPAVCMICGTNACPDDIPVCDFCMHKLQSLLTEKCVNCGNPPSGCKCPRGEDARFLFFYGSPLSKQLIYTIKNNADIRISDFLADLLLKASGINPNRYDAVTYVPRRKRAIRKYGYDQSKLIAGSASKMLACRW